MAGTSNSSTSSGSADSSGNIDIGTPYTPKRPAPVVSISVNHPIAQVARKIKNFLTHKQTLFSTTFTIKVTPIVALVSLLGLAALFGGGITTAFTFGKTVEEKIISSLPTPTPKVIQTLPAEVIVSKAGIIKATYKLIPTQTEIAATKTPTRAQDPSLIPSPTFAPVPSPTPTIIHYILVSRDGSLIYLQSQNVSLQKYLNLRVLITAKFNSQTNTVTISKPSDIEILQ